MHTTAYMPIVRQNERRVSLTKLGVIAASLALWATAIGGVALVLG